LLYRQLALYYTCLNEKEKAVKYEALIKKELEKALIPLNFI